MLVAFQLALTGLHELSEARWLPSSKQEMALIGPIVRNELFFFVFVFGAAALLILREWQSASHARSVKEALGWSGVWIGMALLFSIFVYIGYEHHWMGLGTTPDAVDGAINDGSDAVTANDPLPPPDT